MKIICIFAVLSKLKGGKLRLYVTGFFCACALQIFGVTPVWNCNRTTALEVLSNGSVTPFFCCHNKHILSEMLSTEKSCLNGQNTPKSNTPTERHAVSYSDFLIEKNAKNKAYFFILSHGLLDRYAAFCKTYQSDNPHRDCVNYLISKI